MRKKMVVACAFKMIMEQTGLSKEEIEKLTLEEFEEVLAMAKEKERIEFRCNQLKAK